MAPTARYDRQIRLAGFGEGAQHKLSAARVLMIGAGGLGCPALQYLAAAGIGHLGIVDHDRVAESNLHRQILYTMDDLGELKALCAANALRRLNPQIEIAPYPVRLERANALALIRDYDIVIDGTDSIVTRYLINDACVLLGKPLVYGAVSQYEGQLAVFNAGEERLHYRDLFPTAPQPDEIPNCAEAGVLGVLPGLIGIWQAAEVIKLITGIGEPLSGMLMTYDLRTNRQHRFALVKGTAIMPRNEAEFLAADDEKGRLQLEIDPAQFEHWQHNRITIIDVREPGEEPRIEAFPHRKIPLSQFELRLPEIGAGVTVLFCQSGARSLHAAQLLKREYGEAEIYSLKGGILGWQQHSAFQKKEVA